jgi:hypothetical protein
VLVLSAHLKRQAAMESNPRIPAARETGEVKPERLASEIVYQGMTLAAVLWLLTSLWGF